MSNTIHIRGGRIVDPAANRDEPGDLFIRNGLIADAPPVPPPDTERIDARGLVVVPGLIDLHVHLREPGGEDSETIETGSRAAARGGFTTVVAMPNTRPPLDAPERVAFVKERGDQIGLVTVIPTGCITRGREGRALADLSALVKAGAGALTDDGSTVPSDDLMRNAMLAAFELGVTLMDHAEDRDLERKGVMHQGDFSKHWNIRGIPSEAEVRIVRRDIELARQTGCRLHIQHVSAAESVVLIHKARQLGGPVSGELTPHHLALTDADVRPGDANFKMNPPLRAAGDRAALIAGVCDGTLQAFATDHAPHTASSKALGFLQAPPGIVGLETAVGITYTDLVLKNLMSLADWVRRWTVGPARVLGIPEPGLRPGAVADVSILDLDSEWVVRPEAFLSKSRNTPFGGRRLVGRAAYTIRHGVVTWREG